MIKNWYKVSKRHVSRYRKQILYVAGGLVGLIVVVQLAYPTDRLLPFESIETVEVSGWSKSDALKLIDERYKALQLPVYFGQNGQAYRSPQIGDVGISVSNQSRIDALGYPWYLRLVPTSLFWAQLSTDPPAPVYQRDNARAVAYITKELGSNCQVAPKNASLKANGAALEVVPSQPGGTCRESDVSRAVEQATPTLTGSRVTIPVEMVDPAVNDEKALQISRVIKAKVGNGILLKSIDTAVTVDASTAYSWMDFVTKDDTLTYVFNVERATPYLRETFAAKVAAPAGVTTVSTSDFVETSRQTGPGGRALDESATLTAMTAFINGTVREPVVATKPVAPTIKYVRNYSPTDAGLAALMQNFTDTHPGTYGISLVELSGRYRHAAYRGNVPYTTASTYKLFVAYSTLRRVEAGQWQWSDQIAGGRDLAKCFDDMIVKSDNACAEALLKKIGYNAITSEARAIGCVNTSFLGKDGIKSSSEDEAVLLSLLYTGQVLDQQSSRDRLLEALRRNVYRQGIPSGVKGMTVANKVGFLDRWLHDAAIVYSPSGPYVLVVMTEGSSWATIADLTRQIEALRTQ